MNESNYLENIGYSNLKLIIGATCGVYIGEKENKKYILKFIPNNASYPNNQIKNEIKASKKLKGLNGVLCDWKEFDVDFSKDNLIIRPYVEGKELIISEYKRNKKVVASIEETISKIHERGVCNIDFFGGTEGILRNILVDEKENIFLMDFGLVKFRDEIPKSFFYDRVENDFATLRKFLKDRRYRDFPKIEYLV